MCRLCDLWGNGNYRGPRVQQAQTRKINFRSQNDESFTYIHTYIDQCGIIVIGNGCIDPEALSTYHRTRNNSISNMIESEKYIAQFQDRVRLHIIARLIHLHRFDEMKICTYMKWYSPLLIFLKWCVSLCLISGFWLLKLWRLCSLN